MKLIEDLTQEQLTWICSKIVKAMQEASKEQKTKKALHVQSDILIKEVLQPLGKEIKRRKNGG